MHITTPTLILFSLRSVRQTEANKTLVLDLDETLAHSSFMHFKNCTYNKQIKFEGTLYTVFVLQRPHVSTFLEKMSRLYEIIFYTASVKEYAEVIINYIDPNNYGSARLFRESWKQIDNSFVKDLKRLGRDLKSTIIIDNSPIAYCLNPDNGIPIKSFYEDLEDDELLKLIPILEELASVEDVQQFIRSHIEVIDKEHAQFITNPNIESVPKVDKTLNTEPQSIKGKIEDVVEDKKQDLEYFDNSLKAEDLDESKIDEESHLKSINDYSISSRTKPNVLLSHYKAFTSQKYNDNAKQFDIRDYMQIGKRVQDGNRAKYSNIQIKTKRDDRSRDSNMLTIANDPLRSDSPVVVDQKQTYEKLKEIVKESLSGLNNEKIIQKLDRIRNWVARDNGVVISSKSLAESLSHSIVKTQQMGFKGRQKQNFRFNSIDSKNQLLLKWGGTNSNTMTNSLHTSIEHNERLRLKEELANNSKSNSRRRVQNSKAHKQSTFFNTAVNSNIESICEE